MAMIKVDLSVGQSHKLLLDILREEKQELLYAVKHEDKEATELLHAINILMKYFGEW